MLLVAFALCRCDDGEQNTTDSEIASGVPQSGQDENPPALPGSDDGQEDTGESEDPSSVPQYDTSEGNSEIETPSDIPESDEGEADTEHTEDENPSGVPEGAWWNNETIFRANPLDNFEAVIGWAQAATLSKNQVGEPATIVIDYWKLIEEDPVSGIQVPYEEHYDIDEPRSLYKSEGGLYDRSPHWFATDEHTPIIDSEIKDGFLTIDVSATPNNIVHWWTNRLYNSQTARYYLEMRVKIEGKMALQLGLDYWVDLHSPWNGYDENCEGVNNCEAWVSDWYGDTDGEFITIICPHY